MSLPQSQKTSSSKPHKKRLNQDQIRVLQSSFNAAKKLEPERKLQLARDLGVPPRQIAVWYQNKRARWKNQSLELNYEALQLRLEAALADKKVLEKEVEFLGAELKRIQDRDFGLRAQLHGPGSGFVMPPGSSMSSGGCDDGTVSSGLMDNGYSSNLEFEELYACLMRGGSNHGQVSGGDFFLGYKL